MHLCRVRVAARQWLRPCAAGRDRTRVSAAPATNSLCEAPRRPTAHGACQSGRPGSAGSTGAPSRRCGRCVPGGSCVAPHLSLRGSWSPVCTWGLQVNAGSNIVHGRTYSKSPPTILALQWPFSDKHAQLHVFFTVEPRNTAEKGLKRAKSGLGVPGLAPLGQRRVPKMAKLGWM